MPQNRSQVAKLAFKFVLIIGIVNLFGPTVRTRALFAEALPKSLLDAHIPASPPDVRRGSAPPVA